MKVFFPLYHISVNRCFVEDIVACGYEPVIPDRSFEKTHIDFYAPPESVIDIVGSRAISYNEFMASESMLIVIPCVQHVDDLTRLYESRGRIDTIIYLTANSNAIDVFPLDGSNYIISHDLYFHRETKTKNKILYFNRPYVSNLPEKDLRASFESKKVFTYINNFYSDVDGFDLERPITEEFKQKWVGEYKVFGYGNPDGWPQPPRTHELQRESMFTFTSKRRETWGQNVSESMLLGTPAILFRQFLNSTYTSHFVNPDTFILVDTVDELIERLTKMTFEEYECLSVQARAYAQMFTSNAPRRFQLKWLLDKASLDKTA